MKFSKNLAVRISIWFEMGKNRKKIWHSLTALYKTTLQLGVRNLPKVFTRQQIYDTQVRRSTSKPPSLLDTHVMNKPAHTPIEYSTSRTMPKQHQVDKWRGVDWHHQ